jgi:uncharacterized membrane protein YhiD involved in acid resistance
VTGRGGGEEVRRARRTRVVLGLVLVVTLVCVVPAGAKPGQSGGAGLDDGRPKPEPISDETALVEATIRLPVASALGAVLAFRPRRRGTPARNPAVIHTQILLAVVGALVMMVVGSSLARAFGIVGAAGLIRYRAKVDDPKDAGVMLAALGVGLATGVGLYYLAAFATVFFLLVLGIVESLSEGVKLFELTVETENVGRLRADLEDVLRRQGAEFEMRSSSEKALCYAVRLPLKRTTDRVSNAIRRLTPGQVPSIGWEERKVK